MTDGRTTRRVNRLVAKRTPRDFDFVGAVRSRANQQFIVLTIGPGGTEPLETVSNSLADTVLIKTGSGNGDLESSQWGIGRPGATGMVSVVARYLSFLTEIFGWGVADAEKA